MALRHARFGTAAFAHGFLAKVSSLLGSASTAPLVAVLAGSIPAAARFDSLQISIHRSLW